MLTSLFDVMLVLLFLLQYILDEASIVRLNSVSSDMICIISLAISYLNLFLENDVKV